MECENVGADVDFDVEVDVAVDVDTGTRLLPGVTAWLIGTACFELTEVSVVS